METPRLVVVMIAVLVLAVTGRAQSWREDPIVKRIAARLDAVRAVDNHTHLLEPRSFDPAADAVMPLMLRSTRAEHLTAMRERFGITFTGRIEEDAKRAADVRAQMVASLGSAGYWTDHLDAARTDIALVNQYLRDGTDGRRLRWVPHATVLLYPLPADALVARSSGHRDDIGAAQKHLRIFMRELNVADVPGELSEYLALISRVLTSWKQQGAVAIKFWDAYLRTLVFEDVPDATAAALYRKGRQTPLARDEYIALQDFLARQIFLEAGARSLPVHIHAAHGVPPFLRTHEADVRNLDVVLTDERFFATQFVVIHGGAPLVEYAAYLALKPHVWFDMSAMPFLYPVPELAQALRTALMLAPGKVLFSTDAAAYPTVPVGADLHHLAVSRAARDALALALAGLVRDGIVDVDGAVAMGTAVLHGNADRLYRWTR